MRAEAAPALVRKATPRLADNGERYERRRTNMRMYRCDRCGRIVEGGIRAFVRKPARAGVWHLSKKTHICRDCRDSFDAWMDNGPEEGAAVEEMRGTLERMRESLKRAYDERDRTRETMRDMKRDNEWMHERLEGKGELR